ncbi:MAG: hypothetical protein WC917_04830, partial [Bacilli bacterium]
YGAAVSQKGYDVKTCDDRFLVYSSAFQSLKIYNVYSVSTTIPTSGTHTITIAHNLGFYAPFVVIYNGSSSIGVNNSYFFCDSLGLSFTEDYHDNTENKLNELRIVITPYFDDMTAGATVYFTVILFLDDFRTFNEKIVNSGTTLGSSSTDYGIRISKDGYDVKTCDDINCVMSSSFFSHIVNKKGIYTATSDGVKTISHSLGYFPSTLIFKKRNGNDYINYVSTTINTSSVQEYMDNGDMLYYIIFKQKNG